MKIRTMMAAIMLAAVRLHFGYAQEITPLSFEVATIRDSDPGKPVRPALNFSSNRLQVRGMTLKELITISYELGYGTKHQVIGGPGWMETERFDVTAKEDESVWKRLRNLPASQEGAANRQLIRELLAERFGLKVHQEQKVLTTYTLEVAKGGPKLSPGQLNPHLPADIPQNRVNVRSIGSLEAHNTDMTLFVKVLSSQAELDGLPVVDGTGLKGKYDFTLKWTPFAASVADPSDSQPPLFDALQEQLGLRVKSRKHSVDVLVVDAADKPSAN